jgi:hypothetical protein
VAAKRYTMRNETLKTLEDFFQKNPFMKAGAVSRVEVDAAFIRFRFTLPEDYLSFVETYGGAIVGPYPIFGLRKAAPMGIEEASALDVTRHFVKQRWPGTENWLVISTDHSGNPVGLASDGQIWISDHDNGQVTVIAPSFESFLREWCLKLSA